MEDINRNYSSDCLLPGCGNVIFSTLFQHHYQIAYTADLDAELAEYIQQVAQQTVLDNRRLLNLPQ